MLFRVEIYRSVTLTWIVTTMPLRFGLNFKDVYEHLKIVVYFDDIRDVCKVDSDIFNVTVTPQAKAGDTYVRCCWCRYSLPVL